MLLLFCLVLQKLVAIIAIDGVERKSYLPHRHLGQFRKPAALDFTVTSLLNHFYFECDGGSAASAAELRKHAANDATAWAGFVSL